MDDWIVQMIKARSRRRLAAWLIVFGIGVCLTWTQQRYIVNCLQGPFTLGPDELGSIQDPASQARYFVTVHGDSCIDTGVQEITVTTTGGVETGRKVTAHYYALAIGPRLLFVKTPKPSSTTATGALVPTDSYLVDRLLGEPHSAVDPSQAQAIREKLYSFYIDDDSFREGGYIVLGAWVVFGGLLFIFVRRDWRLLCNPESHPVVARARAWGDPMVVGADAQRESLSLVLKAGGGWRVGERYVIQQALFSFDIFRWSDLLWAYKNVTRRSINFIPTGKSYSAVLHFATGSKASTAIQAGQKVVDRILEFALERAPWAILGYSAELKTVFDKKPEEFRAAVEQRKSSKKS